MAGHEFFEPADRGKRPVADQTAADPLAAEEPRQSCDPAFKHGVVVGFDGSTSSERALAYAIGMARRLAAGLIIVHVANRLPTTVWAGCEPPVFVDVPDHRTEVLGLELACAGLSRRGALDPGAQHRSAGGSRTLSSSFSAGERAMRWVRTSVSVSERNSTPSASSLRRSSAALSMMPLCTTAILWSADRCGWAFDVGGGAVGGPAGVGDAGGALEARRDPGLQVTGPALGLDHLQAGRFRRS
ncbi:hypothetical protein SFUMM280S_05697 [Streptomyces fumanus]